MTNSFDSCSLIVIFDPMKDAFVILFSSALIGLGSAVIASGAWAVANGIKIMVQILK